MDCRLLLLDGLVGHGDGGHSRHSPRGELTTAKSSGHSDALKLVFSRVAQIKKVVVLMAYFLLSDH